MSDAMNHDHAFELLPWLANGTLEADEHDRVESHVRSCLTCRAELKEQRTMLALVREHPTVHLSAEQSFARWGRPRFRRVSSFAAAAAVAISVIVAGVWFGGLGDVDTEPDYRSLSTDAGSGAVRLDIVFADGTTEEQMRGLLEELEGTIVSGPSTLGRYTVRLERTGLNDSDVDHIVRGLLADERVRFAGQSFMGDRPE